jgi:hypothetical protein
MSYFYWDEDMWERVSESGPNWLSCGWRLRDPEEVAKIKSKKRVEYEEKVLAEAKIIRARRASKSLSP